MCIIYTINLFFAIKIMFFYPVFSARDILRRCQRYRLGGTGGNTLSATDTLAGVDRFGSFVFVKGDRFYRANFHAVAAGKAHFRIDDRF